MNWLTILKQLVGTGTKPQQFPSYIDTQDLGFTENAKKRMGEWHLSEKDIRDVYFHDEQTGRTVITSAWKRGRY